MGRGMQLLYVFYKYRAGMSDVKLTLFSGCRHEFLNERAGQEKRYRDILEFFETH